MTLCIPRKKGIYRKNCVELEKVSEIFGSFERKHYFCTRFEEQTNSTIQGKVLEWLKRHAWKACKPLKGFVGSNPILSAKSRDNTLTFSELSLLFVDTVDKLQTFTDSSLAGRGR